MVERSDAVVHPGTVVVKDQHASVAEATVLRALRSQQHTGGAEITTARAAVVTL